MAPTPEHIEVFAPIEWATPYLMSPEWQVSERMRGEAPLLDNFCRETIRQNDGVQHWLELHPKMAPGDNIKRSISLLQFGSGISGFVSTAHGGALLTMMDEAVGYVMVASEVNRRQIDFAKAEEETLQRMKLVEQGTPLSEALAGLYLTASLEVKFLKPILCPGVVGIETELLENKGRMMKMKATMKDGGGTPLLITSAVFVRLGAKL